MGARGNVEGKCLPGAQLTGSTIIDDDLVRTQMVIDAADIALHLNSCELEVLWIDALNIDVWQAVKGFALSVCPRRIR